MHTDSLPRLLYWADLPVTPTSAGATLLHRLLEAWPAEKLMIVTPDAVNGCPLPGVRKVSPPRSKLAWLYRTRLGKWCMSLEVLAHMAMAKLRAGRPPAWLRQALEQFRPQAILTVGIAGAWIPAAALARFLGVPLHVIVHDDHHYAYFWAPQLRGFGETLFGSVYRQAVSRMCISAPMEKEYARRFGVSGEVLLPSRGKDSVFFGEPPARIGSKLECAKVFYAGSIYGTAYENLDRIAEELARKGHRLIVYSPSKPPEGFVPRALEIRDAVPSAELVKVLHEEADIMLLLTIFSQRNRDQVQTLFPSKLVDYTAAALPVVVAAPAYACIVDYLERRPDAGYLVKSDTPADIAAAVERLVCDFALRKKLALGAVATGLEDFSYERAWDRFSTAMGRLAANDFAAVASGV